MTLDEAIEHAKKKASDESVCEECRNDHSQLAGWLEELKEAKSLLSRCRSVIDTNSYGYAGLVEVVYAPDIQRLLLDIDRICGKIEKEKTNGEEN